MSTRPALAQARRIALVIGLGLLLWLQGGLMAYENTAMASGIEVCSASGPKRVDGNGKPLPSAHAGHDCCCLSVLGLLPSTPPAVDAGLRRHERAGGPISAGRLAAEWLAPLSRGPPVMNSAVLRGASAPPASFA